VLPSEFPNAVWDKKIDDGPPHGENNLTIFETVSTQYHNLTEKSHVNIVRQHTDALL